MRFLADESCDFRVVRAAGHDVTAVIEAPPGAEDSAVIDMAAREQRVFVTEDRDFGQLAYAAAKPVAGVILLRFPSNARATLPAMVADVVAKHGAKLSGRFVVLQPGRMRLGGKLKDRARRALPRTGRRVGRNSASVLRHLAPARRNTLALFRPTALFNVFQLDPTSCAQAVACLFDTAEKSRVMLKTVLEPILFRTRSRSARPPVCRDA